MFSLKKAGTLNQKFINSFVKKPKKMKKTQQAIAFL
jgi:hypothetical protein